MFKVNDQVKLIKIFSGWDDSKSDPVWNGIHGKVIGIVTKVIASMPKYPFCVSWKSLGTHNDYASNNLELIEKEWDTYEN